MTFYLKVSLDNYSILNPVNAVRWEPIRIRLKNCIVSDFTFPTVSDVQYTLYTPVIYIQMTQFTEAPLAGFVKTGTTCGYTVTYTVLWRNYYDTVIPLPPFITWNAALFRFEVYSKDPADLTNSRQGYKLELTGSIASTDMNPVFKKT